MASPTPPAESPGTPDSDRRWWSAELVIAVVTLVGIATHLVLRFAMAQPEAAVWPLWAVLVLGGVPLVWELARNVARGNFGSDLLAGVSIVTAALLGEWLAGAIVVLMLSGGEALEAYAAGRASSVLEALASRMPQVAHRRTSGGELVDIEVSDIAVGDRLVVLPHETCPVDGVVVEGRGVMDESYLTGEPYEISKAPGAEVISGAINGDTALTIEARRLPDDSRYAKIMAVMAESQQSRPQIRRLGDKLGAVYTPVAVAIGLAAGAISGEPVRFLAVVIVATPCPLLIGIPVAIIGAISLAAKRAVIIRDPTALEQIDRCTTLLVDKTGTLTVGRPELTDIVAAPGADADAVLALVASAERYSKHPLAVAIVKAANRRGLPAREVADISEPPGQGLVGHVGGHKVRITGRNQLVDAADPAADLLPAVAAGLECVVLVDDQYAATLRFHDEPRAEGRAFIEHLRPYHGFDRVLLVSGDRHQEVEYLAEKVGIEEVFAEQSPEDKVAIVERETARAPTVFLGDGINDAPAMAHATVGIAFGRVNEVTSEAAGAVILEPSLIKVDELFHIGRRLRRIALQSALGGMALSVVGMGFAAFGMLPPVAGAIAQEVIDLFAVLNALRMARTPRELSDVPGVREPASNRRAEAVGAAP